jgi:hypothetical protein
MTWKWRILQVVKFLVLVIAFYVFKVQDLPWWFTSNRFRQFANKLSMEN